MSSNAWAITRPSPAAWCACSWPASTRRTTTLAPAPGWKPKCARAIRVAANLDEDRILNGLLTIILAIRRTNYWQRDAAGPAQTVSVVQAGIHGAIPFLPQPRPLFEIWVYGARVEGVHLRGSKVARGGLRWSDRMEDFRTEVLGLVKAQMVKTR